MARFFEKIPLNELAIEISVCLGRIYVGRRFSEKSDDQLVPTNGTSYQGFCTCPDESILLILDLENNRERQT